jgi:hypothetical protein
MKTLTEIIDFYGSDKNLSGYTKKYEQVFESIRQEKFNLLEIGIGTIIPDAQSSMANTKVPNYKPGASLRSWQEYFPNAMIYGGDIQPDTQFEENRIKTFLFDSTNPKECDNTLGDMKFKIIIDDGLHTGIAQISTFINLYSRVESNGIYVIEDINQPHIFQFLENKIEKENIYISEFRNLLLIFKK